LGAGAGAGVGDGDAVGNGVGEGDDVPAAVVALGDGANVRRGVRVGAAVGFGVLVGFGVGVSSGHVRPGMHGGVGDGVGVGVGQEPRSGSHVGDGDCCAVTTDADASTAARDSRRTIAGRRLIYISTTRWVSVERTPGSLWIRSRTTSAR